MKIEFGSLAMFHLEARNDAEVYLMDKWSDKLREALPNLSLLGETHLTRTFAYNNTHYDKKLIREQATKTKALLK